MFKEELVFKRGAISYRNGAFWNGRILFFSEEEIWPCYFDLNDNICHIDMSLLRMQLSLKPKDKVIITGDIMYALTRDGTQLEIYDLLDKNAEVIPLDCNAGEDDNYSFLSEYDNKIYIFTSKQNRVLIYDPESRGLSSLDYPEITIGNCYTRGLNYGLKCYLSAYNSNVLIEFDYQSKNFKTITIPYEFNFLADFYIRDGEIFLLDSVGKVIIFDMNEGMIKQIISLEKYFCDGNRTMRMLQTKDWLWLFPWDAEHIVKLNSSKGMTEQFEEYPEDFAYHQDRLNWAKYLEVCHLDNMHLLAPKVSNYILCLYDTDSVKWIKAEIPDCELIAADGFRKNDYLFYEDSSFTLKEFCSFVCEQ